MNQMFIMGNGQITQIKSCTLSIKNTGKSYIGLVDDKEVPECPDRASYKEVITDLQKLSSLRTYGVAVMQLQIHQPRKIYKLEA